MPPTASPFGSSAGWGSAGSPTRRCSSARPASRPCARRASSVSSGSGAGRRPQRVRRPLERCPGIVPARKRTRPARRRRRSRSSRVPEPWSADARRCVAAPATPTATAPPRTAEGRSPPTGSTVAPGWRARVTAVAIIARASARRPRGRVPARAPRRFPPTAITFSAWRARATSIRFPSGGAESYRRAVTERRPPRHSAGTNAGVLVDAGSRVALIPRNLTLLANRSSLVSGSSAARPDRRSPWRGLRPSRSDHQGREAPPQDTSTATPSPSKYSG